MSGRRLARLLRASLALLLMAGTCLAPAVAEEHKESRWFDSVFDFLKPSETPPLHVPLRKQNHLEQPPPPEDLLVSPEEFETEVALPPSTLNHMPERMEGAQLSHVFRAVQELTVNIQMLRDELGVRTSATQARLPGECATVHVYVKTLEVLTKVIETQRRLGIPEGTVAEFPFRELNEADVLFNVEYALMELEKIADDMGIQSKVGPPALEAEMTHSLMYKNLGDASFLMDALRGHALTPTDVYQHATTVLDEVVLIAERLGVAVDLEPRAVAGSRESADVAQQLLRGRYKTINLQIRLQMDASPLPAVNLAERESPSDIYDMINFLLAEVIRIKLHLGIKEARQVRSAQPGERYLDEVFAMVQLTVSNLDRLAAALPN